ncbi:MAG: DUF4136 domain-containing protein [Bdellovibrionales bacterium]|nr:DUF4136 domain-containing protein [Bdellovibrionales bacterium]
MKQLLNRAIVLLLFAAACSGSLKIRHDFDDDADFSGYKTYDWIEQPMPTTGSAQSAKMRNDLLDKRVKAAVDKQLAAKGLIHDSANPALKVTYFTGVDEKLQVFDRGYSYGGYYGARHGYVGMGVPAVDVYQYKVGTLIIDLIDSKTKKLVWRGSAEGVVDEDADAAEREQKVNEAVSKILAAYPPSVKSSDKSPG